MRMNRTHSRKRIAKRAAQLDDAAIRASLCENDGNRAYIDERGPSVGLWNAVNGPMIVMCDDDVLVHAQLAYMRRNGYPSFDSDEAIFAHARASGWPRRQSGSS